MKTLRYLIEYLCTRIVFFAIENLPYPIALSIAKMVARTYWVIDPKRRKVAQANILRSGIESDPHKIKTIARSSMRMFSILVMESLRSETILLKKGNRNHIRLNIAHDVMEVLKNPNQSLILAGGHFGNWEIAAHKLSEFKPMAGIARKMNNPYVEKLVQTRKARRRFYPIPKHGDYAGRFMEVLNTNHILALLFDQHAGEYGMMIDFFGHPAATFKTTAMLHLVTRTPLCYMECIRTGTMQFEVNSSPLIHHEPTGNKEEDIKSILMRLNLELENSIRKDPTQYLWGHRRWRD